MTLVWIGMGAAFLAVLHLLGPKLAFITYLPRSWWLSFAGGVSVAYVFLHLLPELSAGSQLLSEELDNPLFSRHAVWLITLTSFVMFYGLESAARRSRGEKTGNRTTSPMHFWLSISSYSVYNMLIAYLLHERSDEGIGSLTLFVLAMGLHFLVNDFALREHHKQRYASFGRWILSGAIIAGAAMGAVAEVDESLIVVAIALIAGGVVLNVLKEELPTEVQSRFEFFVTGVVSFAVVLLAA